MTYPSWYIPSSKLSPLGGNVRPQYYKSIFGIERVNVFGMGFALHVSKSFIKA